MNGAVVLRYCRVLSCTLRRKRLVGLTKCCDYFPINRRITVVKGTVQGTGVVHLIQYGTRHARYRCLYNRDAPLSAWCWAWLSCRLRKVGPAVVSMLGSRSVLRVSGVCGTGGEIVSGAVVDELPDPS